MCSAVESVPTSWPREVCEKYFEDKGKFLNGYLHEVGGTDNNCMLTVVVHFDETTPHATYAFVPIKDGKLQAKNILTREFYSKLQNDTYQFTNEWIKEYEKVNNVKLEHLDPYTVGSERTHLSEAQYKEKKALENVEISNKEAKRIKEELQVKTKKLEADKADFKASVEKFEEVKENTLILQKEAVEAKNEYSEKLIQLTDSPNVEKYEDVVNQNIELKKELSLKDNLIKSLKSEVEHFRKLAAEWKNKFDLICEKMGSRIMTIIGIENKDTRHELPSKIITDNVTDIKQEFSDIDVRKTRVIPDSDGSFKLILQSKGNNYEDLRLGFKDRHEAELFQKELKDLSSNYSITKELINEKRI